MIVVAHPDDDILFMNPDIDRSISLGHEVTAVFVTAGDAGQGETYWTGREAGIKAAYGAMAGASDWIDETVTLSQDGQTYQIASSSLASAPEVRLYFLRLPDGGGGGSDGTTFNSLTRLVEGTLGSVTTADRTATYTRNDVVSILEALFERHQPDQFRVHDYASEFAEGEHRDHLSTALLTDSALVDYSADLYAVTSYVFYGSIDLRRNLTEEQVTAVRQTFLDYATGDANVFDSDGNLTTLYAEWVQRQFVANEIIVDRSATASVSGQYYHELANHGLRDSSDRPVTGAFVTLMDATSGAIVSTTMTDLAGAYRFHNLTPGTSYQIAFEAPDELGGNFLSFGFSDANRGDDSLDSDVTGTDALGRGRTEAFTATAGAQIVNLDAAIHNANPSQISGRFFVDLERDGIRNTTDPGIAFSEVQLWDTTSDRLVAATYTDADGHYAFLGLTASEGFQVLFQPGEVIGGTLENHRFTQPDATSFAFDSDVTGLRIDGWGETDPILLGAGQSLVNVDAGLAAPYGGSISGRYFFDEDRDGLEDQGEAGLADAFVYLFEVSAPGRIAVTTTDSQGRYSFDGLAPADGYRVFFQDPETFGEMFQDFTYAPANAGEDDRFDSDVIGLSQDARLRTGQISVAEDQTITNIDAGLATPPPGTIAGRYFHDANANGIDDGETGIAGASVWLFQGEEEITATSTDTRGHYRFEDVPVGDDYFIFFESPSSFDSARFADVFDTIYMQQVTSDVTGTGLFGSGATGGFAVSPDLILNGMDAGLVITGLTYDADISLTF